MLKILVLLVAFILCFPICVSAQSETEISADNENIRYVGRWVENDKGAKVGYFEGEIVVKFSGTTLRCAKGCYGNVYVSVDGGEKSFIPLSSKQFVENLEAGEHTVRIYAPSQNSHPTVAGFICDGEFLKPDNNKTIEFIGDSILEGYVKSGVNSSVISYGTKTADILGFERNIVAFGGITMTPGYGNPDTIGMISRYFYKEEYSSDNAKQVYDNWDTSLYVPDIIVINLGANDSNHKVPDALYTTTAISFYQKLRECYPDTIIFAMVPTHERMKDAVHNAVNIAKSSDSKLYLIESTALNDCPTADGLHLEEVGHDMAAKYVAEEIKKVLDAPEVTEAPEVTPEVVAEKETKGNFPVVPVVAGAGAAAVAGCGVAVAVAKKKKKK